MRVRCPFLLLHSSLLPLRLIGNNTEEYCDTLVTLNEISVFAVKTGANINDAPIPISSIDASEITRLNIVSLKNISDIVPNLYMPSYGSRITSSIYVRGFGSRIDQPIIAYNYDNIPILNKNNFDFDTRNIEHINVIRGAQSTLYGRNSMLGVINVRTLSPQSFQGIKMSAGYGAYNSLFVSGGWYDLFRNNLGIGISADYSSHSGYEKNKYNDSRVGKEQSGSARVRITWNSSKGWIVDNSLSLTLTRQSGYPYESIDRGEISYNDTCFYNRLGILEGVTVSGPISQKVSFTSISSLQYIDDNMTLDQDFLPNDYFTLTQKTRELGFTQEITFKNITNKSGYNWITGAFFYTRNGKMDAPVVFKDYGITQLIEYHTNNSNPDYPIHWDFRELPIESHFIPYSHGVSIYHESGYRYGRFAIRGGLRFEYENIGLDYDCNIHSSYTRYEKASGNVYKNVNVDITDIGHLDKSFFKLLPKLTISYNLGDNRKTNIYINIAEGYKSGGYNTQMFSDVMQQRLRKVLGLSMMYNIEQIISYKPETTWNFELGTHCSLSGNKLTISGNVFYIICKNQQITVFPSGTTTGRVMANAGKSRSIGFESSAKWIIDNRWNVSASFGFADARFVKFNDGINSYNDKHIPYSPLTTSFLQCNYNTTFSGKTTIIDGLGFTIYGSGTGPIYWNEDNTEKQSWKGFINASLRLYKGPATLELWMENITDTKYNTFYFESIEHRFLQKGAPLRGGATIRVSW